jgi:hypothetical protein
MASKQVARRKVLTPEAKKLLVQQMVEELIEEATSNTDGQMAIVAQALAATSFDELFKASKPILASQKIGQPFRVVECSVHLTDRAFLNANPTNCPVFFSLVAYDQQEEEFRMTCGGWSLVGHIQAARKQGKLYTEDEWYMITSHPTDKGNDALSLGLWQV